jgi:hypothetical protein
VLLEQEEVLGGVEGLVMAQQEVPPAMGPVVWLAMEVQAGVQVGLGPLKQLEVLQDMVVLAMAMEAAKMAMALLPDMELEAMAMVPLQLPMGLQQLQGLVVAVMGQDMVICMLLGMEIIHGDQEGQRLTPVVQQGQQWLQAVEATAWGLELQLMLQPMGLQGMGEGMVQQEGRHNEVLMHALGLTQLPVIAQASYFYWRSPVVNRVLCSRNKFCSSS